LHPSVSDRGRNGGGGKLARMKIHFPTALLRALIESVRQFAATHKRNVTGTELQSLAADLKKHHGLPDL